MTVGSLESAVKIGFGFDEARGRTRLTRRRAGGLCHLGKPYWNGEVLGLQLVNPTAGLFSGDRMGLEVEVGENARAALTSPSASRYHTMPSGHAELTQRFSVGQGGWLDYWPEIVIPQRDSDVTQRTEIALAEGASMVFLDLLAPGRVAHGEQFQFRRLETSLQIRIGGALQVRERATIEPERGVWPLEIPGWELCYYGAVWIAGDRSPEAISRLAALPGGRGDAHCGASLLAPGLGVVRFVTPTSTSLKRTATLIRATLREDLPLLATDFRKL